jgi:hypothetical protein
MNCLYRIKLNGQDHEFNSEEELNSFLRKNKRILSSQLLSDKVLFSNDRSRQQQVYHELQERSNLVTFEPNEHTYTIKEVGEDINLTPVTKLLSGEESNRRLGIYMVRPFDREAWQSKTYNDMMSKVNSDGTPKYIPEQAKITMKNLEDSWQTQALLGTSWHTVAQQYFNGNLTTPADIVIMFPELGKVTSHVLNKYIDSLKAFKDRLIQKYPNAIFLTEVKVFDKQSKVAGTVDLAVIDELGKVHIFDYKTSIKDENEWNKDKINSNNYQLGFYRQMLRRANFDVGSTHILPVLLKDIDYDIKAIYDFEVGNLSTRSFRETDPLMQNINKIMPFTISDQTPIVDNANTHKFMKEAFNFEQKKTVRGSKSVDDEFDRMINTKMNQNPDSSTYSYYPANANNTRYPFSKKASVQEIKDGIADILKKWEKVNSELPERMSTFINDAKKVLEEGGNYADVVWSNWSSAPDTILKVQNLLHEYVTDPAWEVIKSDALSDLNILSIENIKTNEVDFIALSSSGLNKAPELVVKGASTILGNFMPDYKAEALGVSKKATNGDVELLKVYAFIKDNKSTFIDKKIGSIKAVNVLEGNRIPDIKIQVLSTLEKWYNLIKKQINPELGLPNDDWKPQQIDPTRAFISYISDLLTTKEWKNKTTNIGETKKLVEKLDTLPFAAINERSEALGRLADMLRKSLNNDLSVIRGSTENNDIAKCLKLADEAIIQLGGIDTWIEPDMKHLGTILGANTTTQSPNLMRHNLAAATVQVTNMTMNNARSAFLDFLNRDGGLRDTVDKLYKKASNVMQIKAVGFNYGVWEKMIEPKTMRFKDTTDVKSNLTDYQKQAINTILTTINQIRVDKMRKYGKSEDSIVNFLSSPEARDIPLMKASMLAAFKGRNLDQFIDGVYRDVLNPNNLFKEDLDSKNKMRTQNTMFNGFNLYDLDFEERNKRIDDAPKGEFETDLELVFSTYMMAHYKEQEINKQLPLINALKDMGMFSTVLGYQDMTNVTKFQNDYAETTLFGASIIAGESPELAKFATTVRHIASNGMMLGAWTAGMTETVTGFFGNIVSLMATKYTDYNFTLQDYIKSYGILGGTMNQNRLSYRSPGFCDAINEIYGLAHMGVNQMVHQTQEGNKGGIHFMSRVGRFFTTLPGYANRLLIFNAQALKDGVITLDKTGHISKDSAYQMINDRLVYNEKLDKRFDLYTNNKAMPELRQTETYKKQKALYIAMKQELVDEPGGMKSDGTLARPYTNRQATSLKTFANDIHGSYDAENKTIFDKTAFGQILMQFKGWLTVKKNRWFTETDNNNQIRGRYEQVLDDTGKPIKDESGDPVMQWKGKYMEGIAQTMLAMYHELETNKFNVVKSWSNMNATQKGNFAYLLGDTLVLGVLAMLVSLFSEPNMSTNNPTGYQAVSALKNSSRDFFIGSTVTAISGTDNPLSSIAWSQKVLQDTWGVFNGSGSANTLLRNVAVYRTANNLLTTH